MKFALLACLIGTALAAPAYAQSTNTITSASGPYIGLGVTTSRHNWVEGTKPSLKLFGGYDFNSTYGVEAGYIGQSHFGSSFVVPEGTTLRVVPVEFRTKSGYLAGKATMPVSDRFSIVTKLGVAVNHTKVEINDPISVYNEHSSSTKYGLYAGIGLKYQLTEKVSLSLDLERRGRTTYQGTKPEALSISASYRF